MPYYLPAAEVNISASYSKGVITSSIDKTPTLVPDFAAGRLYLGYDHQGLSSEDVTLAVDTNGLLKSVKTTSKGQTVDLIKAVNEVITQYASLKEAQMASRKIEGNTVTDAAPLSLGDCEGIALQSPLPLREGRVSPSPKSEVTVRQGLGTCQLTVKATTKTFDTVLPTTTVKPVQFGKTLAETCRGLVCFRPQTGYEVMVSVHLAVSDKKSGRTLDTADISERTFRFLAPNPNYLGYVRFSRGVFAERAISAEFTSGVLTSYNSTRSSELVGFLAVPAAALTTAALIEKLH